MSPDVLAAWGEYLADADLAHDDAQGILARIEDTTTAPLTAEQRALALRVFTPRASWWVRGGQLVHEPIVSFL